MTICEHIKDNGSTCGSPALTGYSFCFFHQRLRQPHHRPGDFEYKLPILDTPESVLMAIQHITQAALDGILEPSRARLVLFALRLAMTALKEMKKEEDERRKEHVGTDLPVRPPRAPLAVSADAPALSSPAPVVRGEGSAFSQTTTSAPVGLTPNKPPLSAHQLKLMRKIIRRGPSDPRFHTAARLLDHQIATGHN